MRPGPKDRSAATARDGYRNGFRHSVAVTDHAQEPYRDTCGKCGARRVDRQLGLEPTPAAYVAAMVRAFREVRRILHPSGTVWLNIGDSYSSGMRQGQVEPGGDVGHPGMRNGKPTRPPVVDGLKPKDMIGIPWMLAFALRDDGWWLRDAIVWSKADVDDDDNLEGSAMPGSQRDRCTSAYELVFMLARRERYFYDPEGCKTKSGAMLRNVWRINPEPWKGAHYATYPRELVRRCVLLGSSQRGVCPECGAPWERLVERNPVAAVPTNRRVFASGGALNGGTQRTTLDASGGWGSSTLGWRPTCRHAHDPVPATILDPFAGSATTGVVATALGRRFVGLDLSRDYLIDQARRRLERPHGPAIRPERSEPMPLFDGAEPC